MQVGRVDHRDPVARLVERDGEGDPLRARGFQDDKRLSRGDAGGLELVLDGDRAGGAPGEGGGQRQ